MRLNLLLPLSIACELKTRGLISVAIDRGRNVAFVHEGTDYDLGVTSLVTRGEAGAFSTTGIARVLRVPWCFFQRL